MNVVAPKTPATDLSPARFSVVLALLIFATHIGLVLGTSTIVARDFGIYTFPNAAYVRESFWHGEWPLWNPYNYCGLPFLAQWNTVSLYPLSLLYLLFPLPWSLNFYCLLHQFWAGLGMYLLARRWTGNALAASVAGLAFAFGGVMECSLVWTSILAGLAWMPWVVWLLEQAVREGGRTLLLAAGAGAMQLLTGAPEVILLTWLAAGVLWLFGTFKERNAAALRSRRLVLVLALTAALAAVQLLPFLDLLRYSYRIAGPGTGDQWSMSFLGLGNFLVPLFRVATRPSGFVFPSQQAWLASYYPGITILFLAVLAAQAQKSGIVRCWIGLAVLGIWLALGDSAGLLKWLRPIAPVLNLVRYPIKYTILVAFVLPLLAAAFVAVRVDGSAESKSDLRRHGAWTLVAICALIVGIVIWSATRPYGPGDFGRTLQSASSRLLTLGGFTLVLWKLRGVAGASRARWLSWALLGLIYVDLFTHEPTPNPPASPSVFATPGPAIMSMNPPPRLGQERAFVSPKVNETIDNTTLTNPGTTYLLCRMAFFGNCNLADRAPQVGGFFPLIPANVQEVLLSVVDAQGRLRPRWADFLGVSQVMLSGSQLEWQHRATARPWVTSGQQPVFADDEAALSLLQDESMDPGRTVILPTKARAELSATPVAAARISETEFRAHRVRFIAEADQPSLVVIAQTFYHHWHARLDGRPIPLWRADHAFQALQIPPGRHQVEVVYIDRGFRAGLMITLLSLAFWVSAWSWFWLRARRTPRT